MNTFYTIIAALLITATTVAQTPEKMSYQAVVRDSGDALVTNQAVGMQISILHSSAAGTAVYVETQTPTTNANGLVTLEIGTGIVVNGDFTTIDWSADSYFIKTETDPTGGSSYTITGTSQLLSVPYALHAKTVESITEVDGSITNEIELPTNANAGDMSYWDGTSWVVIVATPNEGATLQMIAGIPTWTGGTPPPATVGDFRDGGVVFWVDPTDNTHGLVCAIEDQSSSIRFYNASYITTGATGTAIGTGTTNTAAIISAQGVVETNYAAGLAKAYTGGGFNDWFCPSQDELKEMYLNRAAIDATATANGGAIFTSSYYWSSTETDTNKAWRHYFSNGLQHSVNKASPYDMRAVRAF